MKIITGNLLDITNGMILHQVNTLGATGGLAGALRRKWPTAFDAYLLACGKGGAMGRFVPGRAAGTNIWIGHVFGQLHPGPNTDMKAVREALAGAVGLTTGDIYAPYRMGCGLGGGNWDEYLDALIESFPEITIVQRPEDLP